MVTTAAFDDFSDRRRRWLRRASVAAAATAVLGIGTAGLSVAVVSARHATPATSSTDPGTTTSSDSSTNGLGTAPADSTPQGGSSGS
ncbi:hypothetical protein GCM10029976_038560 [Kribbella albertanoniae]|uniref:Uncharacterized protein n=1 Tax=Kribbella albertanoniae TaxID=1266829 RepID=A0A4V6PAC5_9ACTN|nr:hypothetical protein [Kribbella albertanoniae]TDC24505.1 hypothetical protein E1261_26065 [Kribbella albertanoniae]